MPRPLVFGNGSLLIGLDARGAIRDLYWPQVGKPNHLNGHLIRMGIWTQSHFSWLDDDGWQRMQSYKTGTLVGVSKFQRADFGIRLVLEESVAPGNAHFVRIIRVHNQTNSEEKVRLFFTQDLRIGGYDIGDTAFYNPFLDAVIHYKGENYFLFFGQTATGGIEQYSTGIKDFGGYQGTWKDAEDGQLGMNPIAQGSVDSTFGIELDVPPREHGVAAYGIFCGHDLDSVAKRFEHCRAQGFEKCITDAVRYWRAWSHQEPPGFENLPEDIQDLYTQSLVIIRSQIDRSGAILAANDTDIMATNRATYSYMWPRDGALVALTLDRVGYQHIARKFFRFCNRLISPERPFLLQKYAPDGSVGASWHPWTTSTGPEVPFQEDETALTLHSLWRHFQLHNDVEFMLELYESFVIPTANFLINHRNAQTGLPLPSWDLWEERRGVHTNTVAAVIAGLHAAGGIASVLGDGPNNLYHEAEEEMREALLSRCFDQSRGVFYRQLQEVAGGYEPDITIDSAVLGVSLYGALPGNHDYCKSTLKSVEECLSVRTKVGGLARYENDHYFRRSPHVPGNPWIICTLWLAKAKLMADPTEANIAEAMDALNWVMKSAASTGVLSEQLHPETGEPLSVSPLTWSHAEFVDTVLDLIEANRAAI